MRQKFENSTIRDKKLVTTANCAKIFLPRINAKLGGFLTAKKREIIIMSLCSYVFFKIANYANVLSNRECHEIYVLMFLCLLKPRINAKLGGILNREEARNYFYVLMSLCLF